MEKYLFYYNIVIYMGSSIGFDKFGVEKKFPDLDGGVVMFQGDPNSGFEESYEKHGYASIPGVTIWRKTFAFNKDTAET